MKKLLLTALVLCLMLGITALTVSASGEAPRDAYAYDVRIDATRESEAFTSGEWVDTEPVRCEHFSTKYDMRQVRTVTMRQRCTHCDEITVTKLTESRTVCPHTAPMA